MVVVGEERVTGVKDLTKEGGREERDELTFLTHCWQNIPSTARVMVRSETAEVEAVVVRGEEETKEHSKPASSMISEMEEVERETRWVTVAEEVRTETSEVEMEG